jgi:tetratricopeptide (TPR) repeat protein
VKRWVLAPLLALAAAGAALAYKAVAHDREYHALLSRGDAALASDQTFGAIEAYSGAIALRPDSVVGHLRRGETYQRRGDRGDLDQAVRDFRTAVALDPAATRPLEELGDVLYLLRRYPQAVDAYLRYLRLDDRSSRVSFKLAVTQYAAGDPDAAITVLNAMLRGNDRRADLYYLLGMCRRDRRQEQAALQAWETAVALAPAFIAAREELADMYASRGRRADEIEQLEAIAAVDRDHVERQVAVARAQAQAGQAEAAILTLGGALERSPDHSLVYAALGEVWLNIAETRGDAIALGKALSALGRFAAAPDATSDVLTLYGRSLLLDNQNESAERMLLQASRRFPVDPSALLWYSTAAERQNHLEAARTALLQYNALASGDRDFVRRATRIAALSMRLDDPRAATTWFRKAIEAGPPDVALLASLADAELQAGDRDAARATIARALEKDPKNGALASLSRRLQ